VEVVHVVPGDAALLKVQNGLTFLFVCLFIFYGDQ
jgi:hypothetical protein